MTPSSSSQTGVSLRMTLGLLSATCIVLLGREQFRSILCDLSDLLSRSFPPQRRPNYHQPSPSSSWPSLRSSPYGSFPNPADPFHFLPCTKITVPPLLDDPEPHRTWAHLFDLNPNHWSWGNATSAEIANKDNPYAGRGLYLCGYLIVPLDYTNTSDPRIARLAITKFQAAGLEPAPHPSAIWDPNHRKSPRTIVIEPGGPGASGTEWAWTDAEAISRRLSRGIWRRSALRCGRRS